MTARVNLALALHAQELLTLTKRVICYANGAIKAITNALGRIERASLLLSSVYTADVV